MDRAAEPEHIQNPGTGAGSPRAGGLPPAPEPLLVSATHAAALCGRSEASWWRDHAAGRIPAPIKLGGSTRWRVEELKRWVEAGCPPRQQWQALQAARNGKR